MITAAAMLLPCMPQLMPRVSATDELTEISTQAQLEQLASEVNSGTTYEGKTIKLTKDITLSGSWTPIGVYSIYDEQQKPFKGTFNGQGHTISGLSITSGDNVGLFGYVYSGYQETAAVKNLTVTGSITATGNAGGIVAYLDGGNSTVSCCHSDVNITGTGGESSAVGGIVGYNASGTVTNCYSTGTVAAAYNVGGIVGWNHTGTVSYCHYYNSSSDCLSITSGQAIGAIIGEFDNGTVISCRFLDGTAKNGIGKYHGVEYQTAEVQSLSAEEFKDSSSISTNFPNWNFTDIWIMGDKHPIFREYDPYIGFTNHITKIEQLEMLRDVVKAGKLESYEYDTYYLDNDLDLTGIDWEPIGTADHPFTKIFTGWNPNTNLEAVRTITGLKIDTSSDNLGLFGCNSGTINNLTLSGCNVSGGGYVGGLVGQNNGTIQNVTVAGTVTGSDNNVGGIAGYSTSDISYCDNSAAVSGTNYNSTNGSDSIGGIVGYNKSGTVTRCHSTSSSSVMGHVNIGGIAGKNEGTVKLSYNEGTVGKSDQGMINVGGVVGSNDASGAFLENCYNTGSVNGYETVGGVIGINKGTVSYCYSNGVESASRYIGGVAGDNRFSGTDGSIISCYFADSSLNVSGRSVGSIDTYSRSLTASEFIDETKFINWDFNDTSIWTLSKSAGAPVFFYLKVGNIEQEIGYYTDINNNYYYNATGFAIQLISDGTTFKNLYIKGTVSLGDKQQNFEAKVGTEITVKDINVGLVVVELYNKDTTLAVYAMIE